MWCLRWASTTSEENILPSNDRLQRWQIGILHICYTDCYIDLVTIVILTGCLLSKAPNQKNLSIKPYISITDRVFVFIKIEFHPYIAFQLEHEEEHKDNFRILESF